MSLFAFLCRLFGHNPSRKGTHFNYDRQLVVTQCKRCGIEMTRRPRTEWTTGR